jgi:hypothetical protein
MDADRDRVHPQMEPPWTRRTMPKNPVNPPRSHIIQGQAQQYQQTLSNGGSASNLYSVQINANPNEVLDWEQPVANQPGAMNAFAKIKPADVGLTPQPMSSGIRFIPQTTGVATSRVWDKTVDQITLADLVEDYTGMQMYQFLKSWVGNAQTASNLLLNAGLKGIRYHDAENIENYVVFHGNDVAVTNRQTTPATT